MEERRPGDGSDWIDPVVEAYKKDIDRTLLRESLELTPEQRILRLMAFVEFTEELRRAGREIASARSVSASRSIG